MQRAVRRAAYQAFVTQNIAILHFNDRLETRRQLALRSISLQMRQRHRISIVRRHRLQWRLPGADARWPFFPQTLRCSFGGFPKNAPLAFQAADAKTINSNNINS
jgi:hypothetical protein